MVGGGAAYGGGGEGVGDCSWRVDIMARKRRVCGVRWLGESIVQVSCGCEKIGQAIVLGGGNECTECGKG